MEDSVVTLRSPFVLVCGALLGMAAIAGAGIPTVMSYQGMVTDASGAPVPNATYPMQFQIYDAATAGAMLWDSGSRNVAVAGGVFSVLLGESPQPPITLDFSQDYWLQVTFNGVDQTPRQRLGSVGYAFMASGLVPGTDIVGSVTTGTQAAISARNTATTGSIHGVYGSCASSVGNGVYGYASALAGVTCGVQGKNRSVEGWGVSGLAESTTGFTCGVYGVAHSRSTKAVYGNATASSGATYGVYGRVASTGGTAVFGEASATSGTTYGARFEVASPAGTGVYGWVSSMTGTTYGVHGRSSSTGGTGVYGEVTGTTGTTYGVYGTTPAEYGRGVTGEATHTGGQSYGGYFSTASTSGRGVYAAASSPSGTTYGGRFQTSSPSGRGVSGEALAASGTTYGVYGQASSTSGYGVYSAGNFGVSGSKAAVVRTSKGPTLLYCQESPENWFEDFGEGRLEDGRCHVELDPLFLETVTIDGANPMKVFVQLKGDCRGVYVVDGLTGFDAVELQGGISSVAFTYRVVAKRKGFEAKRLDYCAAAERDAYLYPELKERERPVVDGEGGRQ